VWEQKAEGDLVMRNVISEAERQIIDTVLETICTASHSMRSRLFRKAYGESVQHGYTGWALLCRAFNLLIEEHYEFFNESLWENLENRSYDGEARGQNIAYFSLRPLVFAHAHRRRADRAMDNYERNLYEDRGELRLRIDRAIDKAMELYHMITDHDTEERDKRIKAVACHGLAKLAYLKIRYEKMFNHNRQLPFLFSDKFDKARQFYSDSVLIAKLAGFDYVPPMNGIAWLNWIEFRERRKEWTKKQRLDHLHECRRWLDQSITASRETYAPSMLLQAAVLHRLRMEKDEEPDINETAELISKAIHISPYDSMVQEELDAFTQALRNDVNDGLVDPEFYRRMRFVQPANATKASLDHYLTGENDQETTTYPQNQLLILRRWSSYTPLIRLREHATVGGGYLLEWESTRLAIDPGVGFVRNLHRYGYRVQDLDAVVITHQHIDHSDDTEAILAILKSCKSKKNKLADKPPPKFLLTKSGMERWAKMIVSALKLKSSKPFVEELSPASDSSNSVLVGGIEVFPVPLHNHKDAIDEAPDLDENGIPVPQDGRPSTGCGLILKLRDGGNGQCTVGITSDTGYLSNNTDGVDLIRASDYYKDCDVVVLHISMVFDCDTRGELAESIDDYVEYPCDWAELLGYSGLLYKKHLGFWGVVFFIRDLLIGSGRSDRTFVLSEFGEEMLKNRVPILNEICRLIGSLGSLGEEQSKRIYIGDVGTQVRLPKGSIGCNFGVNRCPNIADCFLEFDANSGDLSIPHREWNDRALAHFCRKHDYLVGNPHALNPTVWGYFGHSVINDELREARIRSTGEVHKCMGNYWL
jgi:hypothetical protein